MFLRTLIFTVGMTAGASVSAVTFTDKSLFDTSTDTTTFDESVLNDADLAPGGGSGRKIARTPDATLIDYGPFSTFVDDTLATTGTLDDQFYWGDSSFLDGGKQFRLRTRDDGTLIGAQIPGTTGSYNGPTMIFDSALTAFGAYFSQIDDGSADDLSISFFSGALLVDQFSLKDQFDAFTASALPSLPGTLDAMTFSDSSTERAGRRGFFGFSSTSEFDTIVFSSGFDGLSGGFDSFRMDGIEFESAKGPVAPVPLPASAVLLLAGICGLSLLRKRS